MTQRSDDGRHIIVDGRRWRATDPSIPEALRVELVAELMAARRAVKDAADGEAERSARARVHDAKIALGERGRPWWEPHEEAALSERVAAATRALLRKRGQGKSICPSDVARIVALPEWRARMDDVRFVVRSLIDDGLVVATRGGRPVDPETASGAIRYAPGAKLG